MDQDDLLSTLRALEPEPEPTYEAQLLQRLEFICNLLEDLKLKQSITNELLLQISSEAQRRSSSDFASQARPIRNNSAPRPIRRWSGNKID
jgi:hypothetical protein